MTGVLRSTDFEALQVQLLLGTEAPPQMRRQAPRDEGVTRCLHRVFNDPFDGIRLASATCEVHAAYARAGRRCRCPQLRGTVSGCAAPPRRLPTGSPRRRSSGPRGRRASWGNMAAIWCSTSVSISGIVGGGHEQPEDDRPHHDKRLAAPPLAETGQRNRAAHVPVEAAQPPAVSRRRPNFDHSWHCAPCSSPSTAARRGTASR